MRSNGGKRLGTWGGNGNSRERCFVLGINERMAAMMEKEKTMAGEITAAALELRIASSDIRALGVEQKIVNKLLMDTVTSLTGKQEAADKKLATHDGQLAIIRDQLANAPNKAFEQWRQDQG